MLSTLLFISHFSVAQEQREKSAFEQSLEQDTSVTSSESLVKIKGKPYRKIEFDGGHYYVVFHDSSSTADVFCAPPDGAEMEHLTEASQQFRRNAAFVRAFHESCSKVKGNQKTDLHLSPEMGLGTPDGKKPTSKKGKASGD
jgi:hypothetical protein